MIYWCGTTFCSFSLTGHVLMFVFFFKQNTAYEMRISDWSSDVCSSDLADRRGERAVDDGDRPRRAAQEDRRAERAMDRRLEALDMRRGWCGGAHAISAPPPNEKKLRKKDEAANAMLSPNTIWMSRRNPPAVSPNARVRTVPMMIITATILATGTETDSRHG